MSMDVQGGAGSFDTSPVRAEADPVDTGGVKDATGLCLSGGGYRAMLFHVGSLLRLYELGVLTTVDRISSVSGGSITAAAMALNWETLIDSAQAERAEKRSAFDAAVTRPLRHMADQSIDVKSILSGIGWFGTIGDKIAGAYEKYLFGDATLTSLPESPSFILNATNVQTGALWRFSRKYMGDWRVGLVTNPDALSRIPLSRAVAASSAFPPVLSPLTLEVPAGAFDASTAPDSRSLQRKPFTTEVVLSDGGVYDNLGLEPVFKNYKRVLVSDAGGQIQAEEEPKDDWASHSYRVLNLIDNQVRSLRKRLLIDAYTAPASDKLHRKGTYWGIRTDISRYTAADALPCPLEDTLELARTPTRLKRLSDLRQEQLINWGYAVCDAAMRTHCTDIVPTDAPPAFPYPDAGVAAR